jgi:hypothetical protein
MESRAGWLLTGSYLNVRMEVTSEFIATVSCVFAGNNDDGGLHRLFLGAFVARRQVAQHSWP